MQYPYALSVAPRYLLPYLRARTRIGRLNAVAVSEQVFTDFGVHIHKRAVEMLTHPTRLLSLAHLCNAIAQSEPEMPPATKPLLEGYIFQLLMDDVLARATTVSRSFNQYGVFYVEALVPVIQQTLKTLGRELHRLGSLSEREALLLIPISLREYTRNAALLLGILAARGYASIRSTEHGVCLMSALS